MLMGIPFSNEKDKAPQDIKDKCNLTEEKGREKIGHIDASPNEYRLIFIIGVQGGIIDVKVGRDFHH